ncbi:MAG TPA: S24/S26 family peptidase [Polyangiales bacterium]|nr:S24/S26 family peptidase [Polyangiales bacterium]
MSEQRDERDRSWETSLRVQKSLRSDAARPEGTWITVVGDSMLPTVAPGTRVHVRVKPPRIGDVVLFVTADGEHGVVHRVVFCAPGFPWLVQSGDNQRQTGKVGAIHRRQLIGVANLPRLLPSQPQCLAALRLCSSRLLRALLFFDRR